MQNTLQLDSSKQIENSYSHPISEKFKFFH